MQVEVTITVDGKRSVLKGDFGLVLVGTFSDSAPKKATFLGACATNSRPGAPLNPVQQARVLGREAGDLVEHEAKRVSASGD